MINKQRYIYEAEISTSSHIFNGSPHAYRKESTVHKSPSFGHEFEVAMEPWKRSATRNIEKTENTAESIQKKMYSSEYSPNKPK